MTDRKQARAMDLPGFPCPPSVRDIPNHAASWGWVVAHDIAQDDDGYLWARGDRTPTASSNMSIRALLAWTPDGLAAYISPAGYPIVGRVKGAVDETAWVPIVSVMAELPGYAAEDI